MSFKRTLLATSAALLTSFPAFAGPHIMIDDAYARAAGATAIAGAAYFVIHNHGDEDDRLIGARTEAAKRAELHTHIEDDGGVMRMRAVEGGFPVPAGGLHALARGGDHVMLMGLTQPFAQGNTFPITLVFEKSGEITVEIPVDNARTDMATGGMDHGTMDHGEMDHSTMDHGDMDHGETDDSADTAK